MITPIFMCYSVFEAVFTSVHMAEYTLKQPATNAIIECNVQLFIKLFLC